MTDYVGTLVGATLALAAGANPKSVSNARRGGIDKVFMRDTLELVDAFAQNDRIHLADLPSDLVVNPVQSLIWFDDLGGAGLVMDVGSTAAEDALVAAQDVTTAAGSCGLYKSVDIANYWKPLWEVLGLTSDPGGTIGIYAKIEGANPSTGTVTWQIIGHRLSA